MREAIDQLVTCEEMNKNMIPMVVVAYSPKSY